MAALEVLTNEGAHALGVAASVGPRLAIEFACVGSKADFGDAETASAYAKLRASDESLASWRGAEGDTARTMPCVAMLPSRVAYGDESEGAQLDPRDAIDVEFSWLPPEEQEFDAVAVFARLYYAYTEYTARPYVEGEIVWFRSGSTTTYYRCIAAVAVTDIRVSPAYDSEHWEAVTLTAKSIGQAPPMRALDGPNSLILLHVSTTEHPIKVARGLEFDYKLRIFLNSEAFDFTGAEACPVYLDSLVPAGQGAMQLDFLKEMAEAMRTMRDFVAQAVR